MGHFMLAATLSVLCPQIFHKFVFPSINNDGNANEILRNSLFWGFVVSSPFGLLIIVIHSMLIINAVPLWWLVLPAPIPFVFFFIVDIIVIIVFIGVIKKFICFSIVIIIITLFFQMMSYHSAWIFLLLITYPLQVGTVILLLVFYCIAFFLWCAFVAQFYKRFFNLGLQMQRRQNKQLSTKILFAGSYFFFTLACFLLIYYELLAKYQHEDGITKFIPSFLPVVFIGFCTWISKNIILKVIDYDKEDQNIIHNNEGSTRDVEMIQATHQELKPPNITIESTV